MDFDFGYQGEGNASGGSSPNGNGNGEDITNITNGGIEHDANGVPADDITESANTQDPNEGDVKPEPNEETPLHDLAEGTSIEVGEDVYTVDKDGNLLDKNNNVFKKADEVKEWLESFEQVNDNSNTETIDINSIQDLIGIQVTDENDKLIEFDNTPAGVKAYLDAVMETKRDEHYETAINTLYQKYPFVNDVINYYITNGNSLKGFNELPDRSTIVVDDSNEAQQESIIRTAWAERNQKGDVEHYLNYLKASGTLSAVAKQELADLQEADREYKAKLEAEAERLEKEEIERNNLLWGQIHDVIKSRNIAGYTIPETIVVTRNGQKVSATPEDFFNYLYRVDKDGKSAYVKALESESPESRRDDEILRAYLKFTGGNYSNLVDMAINAEKVNKLKLKAKTIAKSSVRINKPASTPKKGAYDFGY